MRKNKPNGLKSERERDATHNSAHGALEVFLSLRNGKSSVKELMDKFDKQKRKKQERL